jgi:hypothetical protein
LGLRLSWCRCTAYRSSERRGDEGRGSELGRR